MLNALFGSEARSKLLNLFLIDPEKKYTLKQLNKEADIGLAALRKELAGFKNFGLLKEEDDYWCVNKDFIIFPELKALVAKAQVLSSQRFLEGLRKVSDPLLLAMTGVFTGDQLVKTDILLVGPVKRRPLAKLVGELEKELGREINYTIMDETEFSYRQEVMDIFLYNILNGKTIFLIDERPELPNYNYSQHENDEADRQDD